jgi:hypothetical protein
VGKIQGSQDSESLQTNPTIWTWFQNLAHDVNVKASSCGLPQAKRSVVVVGQILGVWDSEILQTHPTICHMILQKSCKQVQWSAKWNELRLNLVQQSFTCNHRWHRSCRADWLQHKRLTTSRRGCKQESSGQWQNMLPWHMRHDAKFKWSKCNSLEVEWIALLPRRKHPSWDCLLP